MEQKIRMQNVSFRTVDEFLDFLPEDELKITERLRSVIFHCIPDVIEKLSYNVPFYKRHKNICFIWPSSIIWGKKMNRSGVRFGFSNGFLLKDEINFLDKGDRKQIYCKDFTDSGDIDTDLLKSYIFEAALIDEELAGKKKK